MSYRATALISLMVVSWVVLILLIRGAFMFARYVEGIFGG